MYYQDWKLFTLTCHTYSIFWPVRRCLEEDSKWPGYFGFSSSVDLCQWCFPVVMCYPVMAHQLKTKQRRRKIMPPSIWQPLSLTMSNNHSSLLSSSLLLELQSWVCSDYDIKNVSYLEFKTLICFLLVLNILWKDYPVYIIQVLNTMAYMYFTSNAFQIWRRKVNICTKI